MLLVVCVFVMHTKRDSINSGAPGMLSALSRSQAFIIVLVGWTRYVLVSIQTHDVKQ